MFQCGSHSGRILPYFVLLVDTRYKEITRFFMPLPALAEVGNITWCYFKKSFCMEMAKAPMHTLLFVFIGLLLILFVYIFGLSVMKVSHLCP